MDLPRCLLTKTMKELICHLGCASKTQALLYNTWRFNGKTVEWLVMIGDWYWLIGFLKCLMIAAVPPITWGQVAKTRRILRIGGCSNDRKGFEGMSGKTRNGQTDLPNGIKSKSCSRCILQCCTAIGPILFLFLKFREVPSYTLKTTAMNRGDIRIILVETWHSWWFRNPIPNHHLDVFLLTL